MLSKEYSIVDGDRHIADIKLDGRGIVIQQDSQLLMPGHVYFTIDKWLDIMSVIDEIILDYYRSDNG